MRKAGKCVYKKRGDLVNKLAHDWTFRLASYQRKDISKELFEALGEFTKTTTTKEKHEEIAKENKSIADNLKQQRIEFAKMLFKLGDVKTANKILSKELE